MVICTDVLQLCFWIIVYITAMTGHLGDSKRFFTENYYEDPKDRHSIARNFAVVFLPLNLLLVYKFWRGVTWWMTIRAQKKISGDTVILLNAEKERHLGTYNKYYLASWAFYFSTFISLTLLFCICGGTLSHLSYGIILTDMIFCLISLILLLCYVKRIDFETMNVIKHVENFNSYI